MSESGAGTEVASVISADMRAIIGKVLRRGQSYPISAQDIRKWAIAVYFPEAPPAHFLQAQGPLVAPAEFNPFAWAAAEKQQGKADVSPGFLENLAGIAPPPLAHIVNGGIACEYGVPMQEGDVIRSGMSVSGYSEKVGKRGLLLFSVMQDQWVNQRDEVVKTTTMTLVRY